jgi:hypothetical protein
MGWLVHVCGIASGRRELHVPNIDVQRSELPDNLHMQSPASEALPNLARHRDNTESTLGCPVDVRMLRYHHLGHRLLLLQRAGLKGAGRSEREHPSALETGIREAIYTHVITRPDGKEDTKTLLVTQM